MLLGGRARRRREKKIAILSSLNGDFQWGNGPNLIQIWAKYGELGNPPPLFSRDFDPKGGGFLAVYLLMYLGEIWSKYLVEI